MAHVAATEGSVEDPVFRIFENAMGFIPNSVRTMAHMPQLPVAFLMLSSVVFGADLRSLVAALGDSIPEPGDADSRLPPTLVQLIAFAVSTAAGCRYCQAHTSHSAHRLGEEQAKLAEILHYETSPRFDESERCVIDLAFAAGRVPNEATDEHFAGLEAYYGDAEIVQIVAVIAMFGFLNRWNDTMATSLEVDPGAFAEKNLGALGWQPGKHASSTPTSTQTN